MMRMVRRALASVILLSGVGLWVCAAGAPAAAATEAPAAEEAQPAACWECVKDSDCDARCDGPGTGVCRWSGCTRCLCTQ
ncbi:uncharacterized protein SOCE836_014240 [Sorangium cellulosum]|uniref:Secreted protein n=1 Tax=Sorangium cellulosum TaxID=56 RepID=A0A4P2QI78_SORCE|nr:uncharacterized protein SOCE836_014240 [Sorangium cellulosum]WCQ88728.1 hypothetical protein NQZ70_01408 [Sorangium sp. Soce836]